MECPQNTVHPFRFSHGESRLCSEVMHPQAKPRAASRRAFIKTSALALPFLASGCANIFTRKNSTNAFVRVREGRFDLRGKPYFYVGANMWFGCYVSDAALPGGRQRLQRELGCPQ